STTSAEDVDRAGPGAGSVLLRQAQVDRVVSRVTERDAASEAERPDRVLPRQAEQLDQAGQLSGVFVDRVLHADACDRQVEGYQRRGDLQHTLVLVLQEDVEAAIVPGGQRLPVETGIAAAGER